MRRFKDNKRNIKHSQNFINSNGVIKYLLSISNIDKTDLIIEIGPGKGIITRHLVKKCKKVIAIEYDNNLAINLKDKVSGNVEIINMNFLKYRLPQKDEYKVFSNIPFNYTGDIITKLLTNNNLPKDVYIIMQYEAALKYIGSPYYSDSYKSLLFKPFFNAKIIHYFNTSDFNPKPKVKIVFVHFKKKDQLIIDPNEYRDFISFCFFNGNKSFKQATKYIFTYEQQKRIVKANKFDINIGILSIDYKRWENIFDTYNKVCTKYQKQLVHNSYKKMLKKQSKLVKIHKTNRF